MNQSVVTVHQTISFSKSWHDALDHAIENPDRSLKAKLGLRLCMLVQDLSIFPVCAIIESIVRIVIGIVGFPFLKDGSRFQKETLEGGLEAGCMLYRSFTAIAIPVYMVGDIWTKCKTVAIDLFKAFKSIKSQF